MVRTASWQREQVELDAVERDEGRGWGGRRVSDAL
jgi:hypothetical protein